MTKALFKKQMMEVFAWIYRDAKSGKNRSKGGIVLFVLLYVVLFGFVGSIFYMAADAMCAPFASIGFEWLFVALMGLMSVALGVFGSVFNTYASLYKSKDNDMLLSMPIEPARILLIRLSGVYFMGLMYELIVMVPTLIVYFTQVKVSIAGIIFSILNVIVLSVFILTLSCILGWVVALVSGKLKNKNFVTVGISLVFIVAYYYVYGQAYKILQVILSNPDAVGKKVKSIVYPFYHMGLAATGNALSMVIFTLIMAAIFAVVYMILSRSFFSLATANKGSAKVTYKRKAVKAGSVRSALLYKEFKRFTGSASYMLNCGLGIVIMTVAAIIVFIKNGVIYETVQELCVQIPYMEKYLPLMVVAAICVCASMNDMTAPSVSLEGKNIWLLQSMPVSSKQVLAAKLKLYMLFTCIPAILMTAALLIATRPSIGFVVLMPISVVLFTLLIGIIGLVLNLKAPNLEWKDEGVPVKQSLPVLLALFGAWGIVLALGILYYFLSKFISPILYLAMVTVVIAAVSAILYRWLSTRGAKIFDEL